MQWHNNNGLPLSVDELRDIIETTQLFDILVWEVDTEPVSYRGGIGEDDETENYNNNNANNDQDDVVVDDDTTTTTTTTRDIPPVSSQRKTTLTYPPSTKAHGWYPLRFVLRKRSITPL